jgi:hypothetical protein
MAEDLVADIPLDSFPTAPERLRFRLWHLFLLMAVMAVILAITAPNQISSPGLSDDSPLRLIFTGLGIVGSIVTAAAITAAGLGLYWRNHGQRFFDQPGHWLLLEMGIAAVGATILQLTFRLLIGPMTGGPIVPPPPPASPQSPPAFALMIGLGLCSLLFVVAIVVINIRFGRKQSEPRWRWVFYLKAMSPFLWVLGIVFLLIGLVRAVSIDRREGVSRDAAHQSGVILQFVSALLGLVTMMFSVGLIWLQFH